MAELFTATEEGTFADGDMLAGRRAGALNTGLRKFTLANLALYFRTKLFGALAGQALKVARVKADESGFEFYNPSAGGFTYEAKPLTVPLIANFTALNAGTSVATDTVKGLEYKVQNNDNVRGFYRALPAAPFITILRLDLYWSSLSTNSIINFLGGIIIRNSVNSRFLTLEYYPHRPTGTTIFHKIRMAVWSAFATTNAVRAEMVNNKPIKWLKLEVTATILLVIFQMMEFLGANRFFSEPIATYIGTPDQIGFFSYGNGGATIFSTIFSQFGFVQPTD